MLTLTVFPDTLGIVKIDPSEVYTLEETAKLLKISVVTARRLAAAGDLPTFKLGRLYRVLGQSLLEFFKRSTSQGSATSEGRVVRFAKPSPRKAAKPAFVPPSQVRREVLKLKRALSGRKRSQGKLRRLK